MPGPRGYAFWRDVLKSPRLVVAPMVDASELAWRLLSRRYGADLCYTPMLHSHVFVKDARYRKENLASCPEDRPLIVQFCSNDPETFVQACKLAAPLCDAVDLNLGCPQAIARRGHYGAFLQDEWDLLKTMMTRASSEVDLPITAKIRVFEDEARTVEYAKMLERAGASLLTVHGRTRDQKGPLTGLASWSQIKAVKDAVSVPVFANGNIQYLSDVERCLRETGVDGIMSAEGNLYNPALYTGRQPPAWDMALEYLELALQYPCPTSYARGHLFKLFHHCLCMPENFDLRYRLSKTSTLEEMVVVSRDLRDRMMPYHTGEKPWEPDPESDQAKLPFPPWVCQPYVRIPPEEHLKKIKESQRKAQEKRQQEETEEDSEGSGGGGGAGGTGEGGKRPIGEDAVEADLSKKKKKKMSRNPRKSFDPPGDIYEKCVCKNPKGGRCVHNMCRACCRVKCYTEGLDCPGHRILVKTKREKAAIYYGQLAKLKEEEEKLQQEEASGRSDEVQKECEKNGVVRKEGEVEEEGGGGRGKKENEAEIENGFENGNKKENGSFAPEASKKTEAEGMSKHQPLQNLPQEAQEVQSNTCNT
ncbi:tRNA-dihydrouridine(16/17) synthase [NAD(P)(+)]-like [Penaeus vannamei]|uniref:tRNA-dihydrouridine(16/17) synthase [NAD(P)(+)]-like n=1 Tax=Penaeus vannamei TaxID=6689 RepID=UPI00387F4964